MSSAPRDTATSRRASQIRGNANAMNELSPIMRKAPPAISAFVLLLGIGACSHRGDASERTSPVAFARVVAADAAPAPAAPDQHRS